jgi:hypothetical protein
MAEIQGISKNWSARDAGPAQKLFGFVRRTIMKSSLVQVVSEYGAMAKKMRMKSRRKVNIQGSKVPFWMTLDAACIMRMFGKCVSTVSTVRRPVNIG